MSTTSISPANQHISITPGVCGGKPCIVGTRIRVSDIAVLAQSDHSPDEILGHYPLLTLSDVHAALAYYYDNRQTIDKQTAEDERFAEDLHKTLGPGPLEKKQSDESPLP